MPRDTEEGSRPGWVGHRRSASVQHPVPGTRPVAGTAGARPRGDGTNGWSDVSRTVPSPLHGTPERPSRGGWWSCSRGCGSSRDCGAQLGTSPILGDSSSGSPAETRLVWQRRSPARRRQGVFPPVDTASQVVVTPGAPRGDRSTTSGEHEAVARVAVGEEACGPLGVHPGGRGPDVGPQQVRPHDGGGPGPGDAVAGPGVDDVGAAASGAGGRDPSRRSSTTSTTLLGSRGSSMPTRHGAGSSEGPGPVPTATSPPAPTAHVAPGTRARCSAAAATAQPLTRPVGSKNGPSLRAAAPRGEQAVGAVLGLEAELGDVGDPGVEVVLVLGLAVLEAEQVAVGAPGAEDGVGPAEVCVHATRRRPRPRRAPGRRRARAPTRASP